MTDFFTEQERDLEYFFETPRRVPSPKELARRTVLTGTVAGPEAAQEARRELEETGTSPTQGGILKRAQEGRQSALMADIEALVANQDVPAQEKRELIKQKMDYLDSIRTPSMLELAREKHAIEATANDQNAEAIQMGVAKYFDDIAKRDQIMIQAPALVEWSRNNTGMQLFDFGAAVALPGFAPNVRDVINYASPGFVSAFEGHVMGIGGAVRDYKEYLNSLPTEDREAQIRKLIEGINNNKFFTADNDWVKFDMMQTILDDYHDDGWDVALNNIFQVLDWVPLVGSLTSDALRASSKTLIKGVDKTFADRAKKALSEIKQPLATAEVKAADSAEEVAIDLTKPRGAQKAKKPPPGVPEWKRDGDNTKYFEWLNKDIAEEQVARQLRQALTNDLERKPPKSVATELEKVAPVEARALNQAILADATGETGKAVGATPVQVTSDNILPKMADEPVRPAPDLNDPVDTRIDQLHRDFGLANASDEELAAMEASSDIIMRSLASSSPNAMLSKLQLDYIPGGYVARYHVSDSATHGFSSLKLAEDTAQTFKEYDKATSRILVRQYDTDEYIPVDIAKQKPGFNPNEGEYLVEFDVVDYVSRAAALANVPIFKPNSIVGKAAAWLDKSSVFQDWIVRAGNVAAAAEASKVKILTDLIRPMTKLGDESQRKVIQALDDGDRAEKWWTDEELIDRWRGEKNVSDLIAGYKSVVRHQHEVRNLLNTATRKHLDAEGYKYVHLTGADAENLDNLGKYISRSEVVSDKGEVKRIYDAVSKKVIDVDRTTLDALNIETGANKFMKFRTPVRIGNQYVDFAVLRNGEGMKVNKLPAEVIRDIPGYISRIYDAPYILKVQHKSMRNGNLIENELEAVRMYATKGEALRDAERMNLEAPEGVKYIPTQAQELRADREFANRSSLEYLEYSGQLFTSKRGLEVKGLDGQRRLKSVADSIAAARARAARAGTLDATVDKLITNWEKRYGAKYGVNGQMPMRADDVTRNTQSAADDFDYGEAVAFQRHIMTIAGVDETAWTTAIRNFMVNWADYVSVRWDNSAANKLAEWGYQNRHRNPVNTVKGTTFTSFIIFNPLRQLWLQSQQASVYLGLEHSWKYFAKGEGIRDTSILIHGSIFSGTKQWAKHRKELARAFRMPEDEVERLVQAYNKSGFNASVDTHMYAMLSDLDRQLNTKSLSGRIVEGPWRTFNAARKVARRVGFDAGEKFQLMGAFLSVRNKWIKSNPKKAHLWDQPKNLEDIIGQTRAVSFNMDKTGVMQFQKGALGAVFQFMSHATKATQVLIPDTKYTGKLANKAFTNKEKGRIALQQMALYGMGGFGIHEMFESAMKEAEVEVPPDVMSYVNEGIMGTLMNIAFATATQEDELPTDLEFSKTIAPFSGIMGQGGFVGGGTPAGLIIDALFMSDKDALELISGPSYTIGKRMGDAAKFTSAVIGHAPITEGVAQDVGLILDEWSRQLLPIYGNFMRGRLMDAYGKHMSTTGNLGVQVTEGESLAMTLLGATSRRQRQVSEGLIKLRGLMGNPQEEGLKAALDGEAEQWFKYIRRTLEGVSANPEAADAEALMRTVLLNAEAMQYMLDPDEHRYLFRKVQDRIMNHVTKDGTELQFTKQILSLFNAEVPDVYDPEFRTWIENHAPFEGKEEIINFIEEIK